VTFIAQIQRLEKSRSNCASTCAKFIETSLFTIWLHNTHTSHFNTFVIHMYCDLSIKCRKEFFWSRDRCLSTSMRILWLISLMCCKSDLCLSLILQTMPIFILDRQHRIKYFIRSIVYFFDWTRRLPPCRIHSMHCQNKTNRLLCSFFLQVARSLYSQGKVNYRWYLLRQWWDIKRVSESGNYKNDIH